jgi:hypothetical protein
MTCQGCPYLRIVGRKKWCKKHRDAKKFDQRCIDYPKEKAK